MNCREKLNVVQISGKNVNKKTMLFRSCYLLVLTASVLRLFAPATPDNSIDLIQAETSINGASVQLQLNARWNGDGAGGSVQESITPLNKTG